MRIRVDRDTCIGAGLCTAMLPDVFDQAEEDGKVLLHTTMPSVSQHDAVRAAALRCPSGAITVDKEAHDHPE